MLVRTWAVIFTGVIALVSCKEEVAADTCESLQFRRDQYELFQISERLRALAEDAESSSVGGIYVIPGHWSEFWRVPKIGFDAAQEELGFSGEFQPACDKSDATCPEDQQQLFESLTDGDAGNGEASAIGIGCKDATAMAPLISDAVGDVPVITFDADVDEPLATGRHLYLGALNLPAGREAGRSLTSLVPVPGTIHLFAESFAPSNLLERAAGVFESCVTSSFESGTEFAASEYCADLETDHLCQADCVGDWAGFRMVAHAYEGELAQDSEWSDAHPDASGTEHLALTVEQLMDADELPSAIVALHGSPSPVIAKALAEHPRGDRVRFVGWDLSEEIRAGLEEGTVDATIVQNSYFYGYLTAHIAYAMALAGVPAVMDVLDEYFTPNSDDHLLDTGTTVLTPSTLTSYLSYQEECLGVPATAE